jgi:hypothetical protein
VVSRSGRNRADVRAFASLPFQIVERSQAEIHLARTLGLEPAYLEIDSDQASHPKDASGEPNASDHARSKGADTIRRSGRNASTLTHRAALESIRCPQMRF